MEKVTVNGSPVGAFIKSAHMADVHLVYEEEKRFGKRTIHLKERRRPEVRGVVRTRHLEDWEIMVEVLERQCIDIAELDVSELGFLYRNWNRFRIQRLNKVLRDILKHHKQATDEVVLSGLYRKLMHKREWADTLLG